MVMCRLGQTSAMTMALALIPAAAGLTVMKPNLGMALFVREPRWRTVSYGAALVLGSIIISPRWPAEWLRVISTTPNHYAVVGSAGGALMLLAVLRWRTHEGRLLLAMSVIPHALYFYDELPLWLVARTHREALLLTWCSWAGLGGWVLTSYDRNTGALDFRGMAAWSTWLLYLPCLIMVLRRPNEGYAPAWLERRLVRAPRWLRGSRGLA
jgi:hypothetical protein